MNWKWALLNRGRLALVLMGDRFYKQVGEGFANGKNLQRDVIEEAVEMVSDPTELRRGEHGLHVLGCESGHPTKHLLIGIV